MRSVPSSPEGKSSDVMLELCSRAVDGDAVSLRELLKRLTPSLRRIVRDIVGPGSDAEDCLQETLVAVTHALPAFRGDSTVLHFAVRIAIRSAVNARRRSFSNRQRSDRLAQLEKPLLATEPTLGEAALGSRRLAVLRSLLDRLPAGQGRTFTLHAVLEFSPKEISALTGAPVNTVRSRIRLAREAIRRHIEDDSALSELFQGNDL